MAQKNFIKGTEPIPQIFEIMSFADIKNRRLQVGRVAVGGQCGELLTQVLEGRTFGRLGRSVGFVEGELYDAEGRLLAAGSSTANFVTLKKPAP